MKYGFLQKNTVSFKRWSRKAYAVLLSLNREIVIAHVSFDIADYSLRKNGIRVFLSESDSDYRKERYSNDLMKCIAFYGKYDTVSKEDGIKTYFSNNGKVDDGFSRLSSTFFCFI